MGDYQNPSTDNNGNYYYIFSYDPSQVDNGAKVTVAGQSEYAGVSKYLNFSFYGEYEEEVVMPIEIEFLVTSEWSSKTDWGCLYVNTIYFDEDDGDLVSSKLKNSTNVKITNPNDDMSRYIEFQLNGMRPNAVAYDSYVGVTVEIQGIKFSGDTITGKIASNFGNQFPDTEIGEYTIRSSSGLLSIEIDINMENINRNNKYIGYVWSDNLSIDFPPICCTAGDYSTEFRLFISLTE